MSAKLPHEWKRVRLGDLGPWVGGGTPSKSNPSFWERGTIPWVSPKDMKRERISDTQDHITKAAVTGSATNLVAPNSVLVVARSGILQHTLPVAVTEREVALNQDLKALQPNSTVRAEYLALALKAFEKEILARCTKTGTTVQSLELPVFTKFEIPIAPLKQQRLIVAEIEKQFTRLEAGLQGLRRVYANLKRYRAAVLKAAFEGKLTKREDDWQNTTLGEVANVLSGYGFPERLQGHTEGDVAFYKVGDISANWQRRERVLGKANNYISRAEVQELRAKLLPAEAVVFAKIGAAIALNRRAILGQPSLVDNNVMGLAARDSLDPLFLFYFTCTLRLNDLARATTVPSIRKGDVETISLKLPPLKEQKRIVAEVERRLSVIDELEAVVATNLQRATRLRQSILQRAFAGELA